MVETSSKTRWPKRPPATVGMWWNLLREGRPEPPPPLEVMWNSSVESSIKVCRGDGGPLWVEPMKVVPESLLLEERLRPPK
jgi:hypothetical protein